MLRADFANPWVRSVDEAGRPAPAWLILLLATVLVTAVVLGGPLVATSAISAVAPLLGELAEDWSRAASAGVFYLLVFAPLLVLPFIAARVERRRIWLTGRKPVAAGVLGLLMGCGGLAASVAIAAAAGAIMPGQVPATPLVALTAGVAVIGFQTTAEEVCFRGWLQPVLCARWGPWAGGAVTAVLFAGLHMIGGGVTLLTALNLLLGGLFFGLLALRTGGLWAPVTAHLGWNWSEAGGLGLEPDPGVGPLGTVLDYDLTGPLLWSGAEARLNGSLATTLVLAVLTAGLLLAPAFSRRLGEPGRSGSAPSGTP